MEWLKKINPQKVFDNVSSGVDKLFFTDEERAELNIKLSDKLADYTEKSLNESSIRSKSRRIISYCIIFVYLLLLVTYSVCVVLNVENIELKNIVFSSPISTAFTMVLAFFYSGYYIEKFKKKP